VQFNNLILNKRNENKHMKQLTKLLYLAFAVLGMGGGVAFAQQPQDGPPCPTSILAPYGLAPDNHCNGTGCLLNFNNYKWWTAFTFTRINDEGYYNGGLRTTFAPEHVVVDRQGDLHLRMVKDWNNHTEWAGAEAVLMFRADGTEANLGYGDYLVAAEIVRPLNATFATLDPNVALGMFTYERPATGSRFNSAREIDLAEISRWGWNHVAPAACPFSGHSGVFPNMTLCEGNAQFALQDFTQHSGMVKRYDIEQTNKITLVMRWREGQVTFEKYDGIHTFDNLPTQAKFEWTTPPELRDFVPTPGCARFHINLWLGNFWDTSTTPWKHLADNDFAPHVGPTDGQEVEVVIRNFEFQQP
jgi:hypothetical protein